MLQRQMPVQSDPDLAELLQRELAEHRSAFEATGDMLNGPFVAALEVAERAIRSGGKVLLFGNGGSAADAQHIAAEMIRYVTNRPSVSAIALTSDTSALTACSNDMGFESVFERQIAGLGRTNDMAMGISCSGSSPNVLRGLHQAKSMELPTVGLTGAAGGGTA